MTTNYRNEISKRTIRSAPQSGKHHGEGPSDGAQRNARIAAVVAAKKADSKATKEKNIADRTAAAEKRKKETLAMATEQSSGTEARVKIKNVSRPDDPAPDSKDSKLVKTGEIKTKKIDEGRSMSINRNFGLPESLIAATRALLEKRNESANNVGKGKTVVDTDPETNDRDVNDDITEKKGKKKLDPVGKENDDIDNDGDVDKSDKYLHNRRKAIGKAMKEETSKDSDSAEIKKSLKVSDKEAKRLANFPKKPYNKDDIFTKEEVESVDEAIKIGSRVKIHAPGKDYHGIVGNVGEIDHGLHNKSEKRYTVDYNNRSKSVTVSKPQIKLHKEEFSDEELARLEEIASKFNMSEAATERGLQDHEPRIVSGVKGMKSKPFSKKFPHAKAMDKWMDSDDYGNHEVHRIEKA
jgi:hypothetical protein